MLGLLPAILSEREKSDKENDLNADPVQAHVVPRLLPSILRGRICEAGGSDGIASCHGRLGCEGGWTAREDGQRGRLNSEGGWVVREAGQ